MNQNTNVNLIPKFPFSGNLYFSQYDVGRVATINLVEDGTAYTIPSGATVKIQATKPSGLGFSVECTYSGSVVTVVSTETMTNEYGRFPCELRIENGGVLLGTTNFTFNVEKSPHPEGTTDGTAESVVSEITVALQDALTDLQTESTTQQGAIQAKGNEVIASIPSDYTELSGEVDDIKSALGDITKTVTSKNIYDQDSAVIVTGKFLNINNGAANTNADYYYNENYIPIEANTTYCASTWSKSTYAFGGNYVGFMLFYDSDKSFISGTQGNVYNPFTTPSNCAYIRISATTASFNSYYIMIEKGESRSTEFEKYLNETYLKLPFYTVDINGNGNYTSISEAVSALPSGSTILVNSGTYVEQVSAWGKEIHIIGIDRESCILKDTSGNYSTPPLEIGAGSVQNMTIIEQANGAGTENWGAYAIHIEDNNLYQKNLLIRNCYIESDSSSAVGMGLRGGCNVRCEDCELVCSGSRTSTSASPLYFHDADAQAYWGTANVYLQNSVLRNNGTNLWAMITINSIHAENTTYLHFMFNILVRTNRSISQKFNTWNTSGNDDADGWNGLSHMYLTDDSFGNNLTEMNYTE